MNIKDYIEEFPNFPKEGINFKDISPLLRSPQALEYVCNEMAYHCKNAEIIAALDARGFIFAPMIAQKLGKPWVMIRKKGKLPGKTQVLRYDLEYASNTIELQEGAISPGQKVALVDDLLATGGTISAAAQLVEQTGAEVCAMSFVISLDDHYLSGLEKRKSLEWYNIQSLVSYKD